MILLTSLYLLASTAYGAPCVNASDASTNNAAVVDHIGHAPAEHVQQQQPQMIAREMTLDGDGVIAKKREIPDALVDHPEDFDESEEDDGKEERFEIPSRDRYVIDTSHLGEELNEYPLYGGDGRFKRMASGGGLGRKNPGSEEEKAEMDEFLSMMNRGHHFYDMPQRSPGDWEAELRKDFEENQAADDPNEYLEPIREDYWAEATRNQPYARNLLPGYQGYRPNVV